MGKPVHRDHGALDLSVVIPVHNEQGNIIPLLREVYGALQRSPMHYEVVVVDDGSSDGTAAALRQEKGSSPQLKILHHPYNLGQSASLLSGVRIAAAPWIVTLDGDGQNDPADIPNLWNQITHPEREPEIKMIAGHRRRRQDNWLRRASSLIANVIRGALLGDRTPDTGCGLKVFERDIFMRLPHFDHFHRFLPALVQRAGGRVISVEVRHRPRKTGTSHYGISNRLWVGLIDVVGVMWLGGRTAPWRDPAIDPDAPPDQKDE